ncbi:MAG: CopG family transcriptional regulator [Candidatus Riflebacteria bacterium HGW-Riflebacteria-2]|nr:MAG: CopG family transcriptional regulator [Candidatus Riflebacteria bacterium HGW-Riflebacteria-2]
MPKTVTLRLKDDIYELFNKLAGQENRPLSNFIETAVLRFIQETEFVDEFEMNEIKCNKPLNQSLKRAHVNAKSKKGRFVE